MRDRSNPQFSDAVMADPHLPISEHERKVYLADTQRTSTRILLPIIRFFIVIGIHIVRFVKRILPIKIRSHTLLNRLGVWFMRDLISKQALEYIIRHFQYESALINFVADNCGSDHVARVDLMPSRVDELGDHQGTNAIVLHDINIYNHIIDTGASHDVNVTQKIDRANMDFSSLTLPAIDVEKDHVRWLNLDIETSAYIMVFFLVLFLSDEEGERAALSLQFDESLMKSLSCMTGDDYYQHLCPMKYTHWLRYHFDVVKDLRWHMMTIDYAYNHLLKFSQALHENKKEMQPVHGDSAESSATEDLRANIERSPEVEPIV